MKTIPKPMPGRILVELDKNTSELAGGLYIPESAQERSTKATVVAIGPDIPKDPEIEVGSRILVASHAGVEMHLDESIYHLVRYQDCYAVI